MYSEITQDALFTTAVIVFVVFIVVFSFVVRGFDARFTIFLKRAIVDIKAVNTQLGILHDVLLLISTLLKPACLDVLRKRLINPNLSLLKDLYTCSQVASKCQGTLCCCTCTYQRVLYAMTADEELKDVAFMCSAGGINTIISEHGECALHEKKKGNT